MKFTQDKPELLSDGSFIICSRISELMRDLQILKLFCYGLLHLNMRDQPPDLHRISMSDQLVKLANLFHVSTDYLLGVDYPRDKAALDTSGLNKQLLTVLQNLIDIMK